MPTRPSAPTSSSWIWRMPLANSPPPCSSAARRASSRWSSAGSSSLASLAIPRSAAAAASRAARLRKFSKSACVRWASARYFAASSSAGASASGLGGLGQGLLGRRDLRVGGGLLRPGHAPGPESSTRGLAAVSSVIAAGRPRPRRRRPPPRPRPRRGRLAVGGPPFGDAASCCAWARSYIASETLWNAVCRRSVVAWMSAASSEVSDSRTSLIAASISVLEASSICSASSLSWRSAW